MKSPILCFFYFYAAGCIGQISLLRKPVQQAESAHAAACIFVSKKLTNWHVRAWGYSRTSVGLRTCVTKKRHNDSRKNFKKQTIMTNLLQEEKRFSTLFYNFVAYGRTIHNK